MTILVTGGGGYVGMNVVEALLARGERVMLLDRGHLPPPVHRALAAHGPHVQVVNADVCDVAAVEHAFSGHAIGNVIHCAAITAGPAREAAAPAASINVNLHGALNVLEAARRHRVRRVVYLSTASVYGESLYRLARIYEDTAPTSPVTLYGITKFAAERMCLRLRELWQMDIVCARLGSLVGPWERDTGVRDNFGTHSQLARCALRGETAVMPARAVRRDWVYSRDVAAGLLGLLDATSPQHTVYNLSAAMHWGDMLNWCALLKAAFPRFEYRVAGAGEQPNIGYVDRDRCLMDISRITQDIGYLPRFPPQAAYADFLEWLRRTPDFWSHQESRWQTS